VTKYHSEIFLFVSFTLFAADGCAPKVVTMCVFGNPVTPGDKLSEVEEGGPPPKVERSFAQNAALLSFCFVGLQVS